MKLLRPHSPKQSAGGKNVNEKRPQLKTVPIKKDKHRKLKMLALKADTTIANLVDRILQDFLEKIP